MLVVKDKPHCDVFGNQIEVADFVIYAAALGRSPILKVGVVTELRNVETVWHRTAHKVCVVTAHRKTMRNPKTGYYDDDELYEWVLQKEGRHVVLEFTERMVKVQPKSIPKEVREMLKEACK